MQLQQFDRSLLSVKIIKKENKWIVSTWFVHTQKRKISQSCWAPNPVGELKGLNDFLLVRPSGFMASFNEDWDAIKQQKFPTIFQNLSEDI